MRTVLVMLAALALTGAVRAEAPSPSWRFPAPDPARGAELAAVCTACHATTIAPKLDRQRASYTFRALLAYREGRRQAPIMNSIAQSLSDQDLRDISAHVSGALLDVPPRARTDLPGYRLATAQCLSCHGETGIGEFEGMPVLTGQDPAFLARALADYRSGARADPTMRAVAAALDPSQDAVLAEYYAAHAWLERAP